MNMRKLTEAERQRLAEMRGVEDLTVTCEGDTGYGPCGTYLDWSNGLCSKGHVIEIVVPESDD